MERNEKKKIAEKCLQEEKLQLFKKKKVQPRWRLKKKDPNGRNICEKL